MNDLFLINPNKEYKNSFEDYISAYKRINDNHYFNKYKKELENFSDYFDDIYITIRTELICLKGSL